MASPGPDPGSVLCDKCKKSVLEPSQNSADVSYHDRIQQAMKDWLLSPQMWPIGYIVGSPYSPFRVEQELPQRDWRNAFEDLLALESGGEMISEKSREEEKVVAASIGWERASDCIQKLNKLNTRDSQTFTLAQAALNQAKSPGHQPEPPIVAGLERMIIDIRQITQQRVAVAEMFKAREASRGKFSTSRHKDRGQWMASLITSGALKGWNSLLKDSEAGDLVVLSKETETPDDEAGFSGTEHELRAHFEDDRPLVPGTPGPPLYVISPVSPDAPVDDRSLDIEDSSPRMFAFVPEILSRVPERPYFYGQQMTAERITLPNGRTATKVVMKNYLTNGDVEEKVMIQEPGKVLQEVEKARALIHDRLLGFDKPIQEYPSHN